MKKITVLLMIILMASTVYVEAAKPAEVTLPGQPPKPAEAAKGPYYYIATEKTDDRVAGETFSSEKKLENDNFRPIPSSMYNALENPQVKYTYTPAKPAGDGAPATPATITAREEHPEDSGTLADYQTTDTTTITLNADGTTTVALDSKTQVRSGVVRGDWQAGRREGRTTNYDENGQVTSVNTPVYPVTTNMLGQRTYAQTPAYYSRQEFAGTGDQRGLASITLEDENGIPYHRVLADGSTMDRPELAAQARTNAAPLRAKAETAKAEREAARQAVIKAQAEVDAAKDDKTKEAAKTALQKAQTEFEQKGEQATEAIVDVQIAEEEAADIEGAIGKGPTSEQNLGKGTAKQQMADSAATWTAAQELRGFWGTFGLFMKAYDEYSGLRQYSAIGLGWYDEKVQRTKAEYQRKFCLAAGIENCVTSQICGKIVPISSDNVLAGAGPTGQFVTSGIINAERSIPIELAGMTRQQLIDLFGNTTVIKGRIVNLTDPAFDPKVLGNIKVWQYHVQYSLTNNGRVGRPMTYNIKFKRATTTSPAYGTTQSNTPQWYPSDKTLEYGATGTDENSIWKYSATEYSEACMNFFPALPLKNKFVNHICAPFIEYTGGPTAVGEEPGTTPEEPTPAQQPGTFI